VGFACRMVSASAAPWIGIRDGPMDATTVSIAVRVHWACDASEVTARAQFLVSYSSCELLASQTTPTWNQIIVWLREMETLRQAAA